MITTESRKESELMRSEFPKEFLRCLSEGFVRQKKRFTSSGR